MTTVGVRLETPLEAALQAHARPAVVDRLLVLDAARVIAALGVVWLHAIESLTLHASGVLGRFSVAFYTIVAVLFVFEHLERHPQRSFLQFAWGRVRRLYAPFLAWTVISLPLLMFARWCDGGTPVPDVGWNLLISGATSPMWFIPFVVVSTMIVFPIAKWVGRSRTRAGVILVIALALAVAMDYLPWSQEFEDIPVVGQMMSLSWNRWSAVSWGVVLAIVYRLWLKESPWRSWVGIAGGVATVAMLAVMWQNGPQASLKVMTGLAFALLTLAPWRGAWVGKLAVFGRISFGIYFVHMTVILLLRSMAAVLHVAVSWQRNVTIYTITCIVCIALMQTMRRADKMRWLVA